MSDTANGQFPSILYKDEEYVWIHMFNVSSSVPPHFWKITLFTQAEYDALAEGPLSRLENGQSPEWNRKMLRKLTDRDTDLLHRYRFSNVIEL